MSGMGGLVILLIVLVYFLSAMLLIVAPLAVPVLTFYLLRRFGIQSKPAILYGVAPVFLLSAWVLSGLYDLSNQCENTSIARSSSEKLGPKVL